MNKQICHLSLKLFHSSQSHRSPLSVYSLECPGSNALLTPFEALVHCRPYFLPKTITSLNAPSLVVSVSFGSSLTQASPCFSHLLFTPCQNNRAVYTHYCKSCRVRKNEKGKRANKEKRNKWNENKAYSDNIGQLYRVHGFSFLEIYSWISYSNP